MYQDQGTEGKINEEERKPEENIWECKKTVQTANVRKKLGTNTTYWQVLEHIFGVLEGEEKEAEQMLAGIISENIIKLSKDNMKSEKKLSVSKSKTVKSKTEPCRNILRKVIVQFLKTQVQF